MEDTLIPGFTPSPLRRTVPATAVATPKHRRERTDHAFEKRAAILANNAQYSAPPADPRETHWRHQHWAGKRKLVLESMTSCGCSAQSIDRFTNCGAMARSEWSEEKQRRRLSAFYCHSRHCEPCARAKGNKIAANLKQKLQGAAPHRFRLITLTLKHSNAPLKEQLEKLYKSFRALRQTDLWKRSQVGGASMLEVKWNGKQWHPHLHLVSEGTYLSKFDLSELWHKITGDSFIVDLRKIDRVNDAAHYVTKYICKSTSDSVWTTLDTAQEWIHASKGVRTANTYGTWRKWPLLKVTATATDWKVEDTLVRILERARSGETNARMILNTLRPPGRDDEADLPPAPATEPEDDVPI